MLNDISTPPPQDDNAAVPPGTPPGARPAGVPAAGARPGLTQPAVPHVGPDDMGPTRPGAVRPTPSEPGVKPHAAIHPHGERMEPGVHHARIMGDATRTDVIYETEPEDRGSTFSLGLSIAVVVIFAVVVLYVFFSLVR